MAYRRYIINACRKGLRQPDRSGLKEEEEKISLQPLSRSFTVHTKESISLYHLKGYGLGQERGLVLSPLGWVKPSGYPNMSVAHPLP